MLSNATTVLDSIASYDKYIEKASSMGCVAFGFSEHGNILEWYHKKKAIEKHGMKYIHGVEAYVTSSFENYVRDNYHVVLLARNLEGFKELNKLVSKSFNKAHVKILDDVERFYYNPRISYEELINTSDNIIVTTACLGGILASENELRDRFIAFLSENTDRCFLEIQHHQDKDQAEYNRYLVDLHLKYDIPLIAGTDTHMVDESEKEARSLLQKRKNIHFENEDNWNIALYTEDEIVKFYQTQNAISEEYYLEAIDNTNLLDFMIESYDIDHSSKYPKLSNNPKKDVVNICKKSMENKGLDYKNDKELKDRLNYEIQTYEHNGALDLLLLEYDIKKWAREQDIFYGESRGSVSGSMAAYLMDITKVNSMKYDMNFERFMNKERVSLADIDSDWMPSKRDLVKHYVHSSDKYYTAEIVTFNTIAQKGSIRDIGGALEIPLSIINEICNNLESESKLKSYKEQYPDLFKFAEQVEGTITSIGSHPAATICSPIELAENIGLITINTNDYPISAINMKEVDDLNYIKLDILGLDNVEIIYKTCKLAGIEPLESDKMDFNDEKVWEHMLKSPLGVFQFEGDFAHSYLRQVFSKETLSRVKSFNPDIDKLYLMSVANGAIRPAGETYRTALARGEFKDNGHTSLNEYLRNTNGYLCFQEQIMGFLNEFCGYTMGQSDIVRRGLAKKIGTEQYIPEIKEGFIKTMKAKYDMCEEESEMVIVDFLEVIKSASSYAFSLNHSLPYSMIGYMCAWLRYYYPLEFVASMLEINKDDSEKTSLIYNYINNFTDIKVHPIKFRFSNSAYNTDKETNSIYKSVSSIKHLNDSVADGLYELRNNQYESFVDALADIKTTGINTKQLDILINLDYFSEFGKAQKLIDFVKYHELIFGKKVIGKNKFDDENVLSIISKHSRETPSQYRDFDSDAILKDIWDMMPNRDTSISVKMDYQKEFLGYVSITIDTDIKNCIVLDMDLKYKPKIHLMSLKTGNVAIFKTSKENASVLNKGDLIRVIKSKQEFGWAKDDNDKWIRDKNKREWHLKLFEKIGEGDL